MTRDVDADAAGTSLRQGTKVEVRSTLDGTWAGGFVVEAVTDTGYLLRRRSDDTVLGQELPRDAVRRERRNSMWWI